MKQTIDTNPYLCDQVIPVPEMFFGRGKLMSRIYAVVAQKESFSLVGPPRIGKGSVLYGLRFPELQQRYGMGYIQKLEKRLFVFVDMRTYASRDWNGFFRVLNKEIVAQSRKIVNLDAVPIEGSEGFTALVDEIIDKEYRLVLSLDSFEKLRENERLSGSLPMFLRSEAARVSYVVASSMPLYEIFPREPLNSPFYNIFTDYDSIAGLEPTDARALVCVPAQNAGQAFSEQEVHWILRQAGMQPLFLQRICRLMYDMKVAISGAEVNLEQAKEILEQKLYPLFNALWQRMDKQQQEKLGYQLFNANAQEFYESALFRRFVETQCGRSAAIQVKDIKVALKRLSDLPLLSKSRLQHLKVIERQLDGHPQPLPSDVGLAIRTVLYEAWDRLKGHGVRMDTAAGWEAYNVLYYGYFKHHMKNASLATRLGMTQRTFYRKKESALEELLGVLLEMESGERR